MKSLFQGAIRLTLEMVLQEESEGDGRSATIRAGRQPEGPQERDVSDGRLLTSLGQIDVTVPRSREGGSPADRDGSLPAQE